MMVNIIILIIMILITCRYVNCCGNDEILMTIQSDTLKLS